MANMFERGVGYGFVLPEKFEKVLAEKAKFNDTPNFESYVYGLLTEDGDSLVDIFPAQTPQGKRHVIVHLPTSVWTDRFSILNLDEHMREIPESDADTLRQLANELQVSTPLTWLMWANEVGED